MADVTGKQGLDPEREHRERIASGEEWPVTDDGKTIEEEGIDSARMLGCVLIIASAVLVAGVLIFVGPMVVEWLSN